MKYKNQILFLDGKLTKFTVPGLLPELSQYKGKKISTIDLSEVSSIDSAGVAFLDELVLSLQEFTPQLVNMNEIVESAVFTFTSLSLKKSVPSRKDNFFILIVD